MDSRSGLRWWLLLGLVVLVLLMGLVATFWWKRIPRETAPEAPPAVSAPSAPSASVPRDEALRLASV